MNKIVLISQQRQGSTLASTLLSSHSMVSGAGEIFKQSDLQEVFPAWAMPLVDRYPHWYLRYKESQCKNKAFLFKFMVNQVSNPRALVKRMAKQGYKIISIHREDAVAIAFSRCIAEQTKIWFVRSPDRRTNEKVYINPQDFLTALADVTRYYRIQERVLEGIDHLPIHYERDLCRDDNFNYFAKTACAFIGLPYEVLTSKSLPTDERSDLDRIENYRELIDVLRASEWANYLGRYHGHFSN
ncbi:MAG: hypothetical protein FGM54_02000 [Chitinophagaceae bacterium]|nr:hypothetical protein [Chitinophagaceae bacterium]